MCSAGLNILRAGRTNQEAKLYARAIEEYLARHDADAITEAMNKTLEDVGESLDSFVREAASRTLERNEW